jgi:hypothetical protein
MLDDLWLVTRDDLECYDDRYLCTRAELWAAIEQLEWEAAFDTEDRRTARAHLRALLGMDDGEGESRPDSTG